MALLLAFVPATIVSQVVVVSQRQTPNEGDVWFDPYAQFAAPAADVSEQIFAVGDHDPLEPDIDTEVWDAFAQFPFDNEQIVYVEDRQIDEVPPHEDDSWVQRLDDLVFDTDQIVAVVSEDVREDEDDQWVQDRLNDEVYDQISVVVSEDDRIDDDDALFWDRQLDEPPAAADNEQIWAVVEPDLRPDDEDDALIAGPIFDSTDWIVVLDTQEADPDEDADQFLAFIAALSDFTEQITVVIEPDAVPEQVDDDYFISFIEAVAAVDVSEQILVVLPDADPDPDEDADLWLATQVDEAVVAPAIIETFLYGDEADFVPDDDAAEWLAYGQIDAPFVPPPVVPPPPMRVVRDWWDRDEWGNFVPGAGIRRSM